MNNDYQSILCTALNEHGSIHINQNADNWFSAVKKTMNYLVQKNSDISPLIVDEVLLEIKENMDNFIIAKNVALIYSEKIEFVKELTIVLTVFKESINFKEHPIQIIIAFCFDNDNSYNTNLLKQIALIFSKKDATETIIKAKSDLEIINYFQNILIASK